MKIPITMCHGINEAGDKPLTTERFEGFFKIANRLGFQSIDYNDLAEWRAGKADLPEHPIMFDFDHPVKSIRYDIHEIMDNFGFRGNLFINTGPIEEMYSSALPDLEEREFMTWEEIGELVNAGWHIGSHTHTHPNLSQLSVEDPTGEKVRAELKKCDELLKKNVGVVSKDFAFTGTSWSSAAEKEVIQRYRFGRLWIVGSEYQADGEAIRYADLVGVPGQDEEDGGPPHEARYITGSSNPYRLPSMELQRLIYEYSAYQRYLEGAREW